MNKELIDSLALDIIKLIDYDLWKEVRKDDEDNLIEQISDMIDEFIIENTGNDSDLDYDS